MGDELIKNERLQSGQATLKFGDLNTEFAKTGLKWSVGVLEGSVVAKAMRETLVKETGNPVIEVKRQVIKESIEVTITCSEFEKNKLKRFMGAGEQTQASASAAVAFTSEEIVLEGTEFHQLLYHDITVTSVTTDDATAVTLNETTDYVLDETAGKIRRVAGGAIDDGDTVLITGTRNRPITDTTTVGGDTSQAYFPMAILFVKDTGNHETWYIYKAISDGNFERSFNPGGWNEYSVTIFGQQDSTRDDKDRLFSIDDEVDS